MHDRAEGSLGVAVLGMGRWGHAWATILQAAPRTQVLATAGGRPQETDGPTHYEHYRQALDHPGVEAVVVTLPVALHLEAVRDAASRGLHVLCEKPAVASRKDLAELQHVVHETDVVVRVDQNYRRRPWVNSARRALPNIKPISQITIEFAQREFPIGGRERMAHPLIADMAIHHFDLLRHLTAREAHVVAGTTGRPRTSLFPGHSDLTCLIELDDGSSVSYSGTWSGRGRLTPWDGDWCFRGAGGTVDVQDLEVFTNTGNGPIAEPTTMGNPDADLASVWADFCSAISGGRDAGTTVDDHTRSLQLVFDVAQATGIGDPFAAPELTSGSFAN